MFSRFIRLALRVYRHPARVFPGASHATDATRSPAPHCPPATSSLPISSSPRTKRTSLESRHPPRPHPTARTTRIPTLLLLPGLGHISRGGCFRGPASVDLRFRRARPNASAALSPNGSFVCVLARHGLARAHVLEGPPSSISSQELVRPSLSSASLILILQAMPRWSVLRPRDGSVR